MASGGREEEALTTQQALPRSAILTVTGPLSGPHTGSGLTLSPSPSPAPSSPSPASSLATLGPADKLVDTL